jgi:hypothetical protein
VSFWAKVSTKITDLDILKEVCGPCDLRYQESGAGLTLHGIGNPREYAKVDQINPGEWELSYDQDPGYSAFSSRIGRNGGILMRSYATEKAKREAAAMGCMVLEEETRNDGSIRLVVGY